jgi:hypothetical protein
LVSLEAHAPLGLFSILAALCKMSTARQPQHRSANR